MKAKPFHEAKRRLLVKRDVNDFVNLLEEVTDSQGRTALRNQILQRNINGFQPGHAPLTMAVRILISKLKREQEITNPDSLNWRKFKDAWSLWVISHTQLNNILQEFDNKSDFDDNGQCIVPPNSENDIRCFKVLLEASRNDQIDQETIRRFYEYGYFNQCDEIEELISQAFTSEEIKRRERIKELPDQVDRIRQEIEEFRTQISNIGFTNELQQAFDQQISEVQQTIENQLAELNGNRLTQSIESLKSRISEVNKSLITLKGEFENSQTETDSAINDFVNHTEEIITQLEQQVQNSKLSTTKRLEAIESIIADIMPIVEEQNQPTLPRVAHEALEIGRRYENKLMANRERYSDENEYIENLRIFQRRYGLTNLEERNVSKEIAAAVHIAMKAFPALEIADERLINIWKLICGDHLHITKINVELGWIGKQDWFPDIFSDECFDECLEKIDLDISIREMLKIGDMPWAIHLNNCDKSYPDSYLPSFLDWIRMICGDSIRIFLTRSSGTNRCVTNEDVYERIARLPKPNTQEPINVRYLEDQYVATRSEWVSWCCPNADVNLPNEDQLEIIDQFRLIFEENDIFIPITLLREIHHYLQLSHNILTSTRALDWALTLRLLPWIGNRRKLINQVFSMRDFDDSDFPHFSTGLKNAIEKSK